MSTASAVMAAGMPTVMVVTAAAPLPLADELLVPQPARVSATPVASSRARVTAGREDAPPLMALIIADYRLSVAGGPGRLVPTGRQTLGVLRGRCGLPFLRVLDVGQ